MENIVLITFDSVRADHCGYAGYHRDTTPNLDKMADAGIDFQHGTSPATRTNASMAGIMTGKPLINRRVISNQIVSNRHLNRYETIAESLSDRGYTTAGFSPNAYSSRFYGFDKGFDYFEDFLGTNSFYQKLFKKHISQSGAFTTLRNLRNLLRKEEAFRTWDTYIDDVVGWVEQQNKPFFIWIFVLDTHYPYITPREHRRWSSAWSTYYYNYKCYSILDEFNISLSESDMEGIVDIYDDSLRYGDRLIGELRNRLRDYKPTFLIHADHGEAFGEHGFYGHYYPFLYEECLNVPFVIWNRDIEAETIEEPFSLLNMPEIIKKATDGDVSRSALPLDDVVTTSTYDGRFHRDLVSIHRNEKKTIMERKKGKVDTKFFDLASDPNEQHPLSSDIEGFKLFKQLAELRMSHEDELKAIEQAVESHHDEF